MPKYGLDSSPSPPPNPPFDERPVAAAPEREPGAWDVSSVRGRHRELDVHGEVVAGLQAVVGDRDSHPVAVHRPHRPERLDAMNAHTRGPQGPHRDAVD